MSDPQEARVLVDDLTQDHLRYINGPYLVGTEIALLVQLEEAIGSSTGRGSTAGVQGSKSPVNLGAIDLHARIARYVGRLTGGGHPHLPLPARARLALYALPTPAYQAVEPTLRQWVQDIRTLLDPPTLIPLRGVMCADCGYELVTLTDALGEEVIAPALLVVLASPLSADCRVCGAHYDEKALRSLGGML